MPRKISRDFHYVLKEHLAASHIPLAVIASQSGLSRRTLQRWCVNTLPKNCSVLLKVLAFIRLQEKETNQLLQLAGLPLLSEIRRTVSTQDQFILQNWPSPRPTPNQSQPSPNYFVGRHDLINKIKSYLRTSGGLKVCGLRGLGGIGKTTLAKYLAETLKSDFPDGILWGELKRLEPEAILNQFAGDYGEDLTQYSDLVSKSSLVRSILSHKRALIILDNAENDEQLKYLLPPKSSSCAVIITSRKSLKTLRGWELFEVKGLEPKESFSLFQFFLGKNLADRHQSTLQKIAGQLGHFPLAILILASHIQHHPDQNIELLLEVLQSQQGRMNLLHVEEDESVRLTFEISWKALSPDNQRNLALLSQFGGRNFSAAAAAALWGTNLREAKKRLTNFAYHSLIEPARNGRWDLHPLIHDYLTEKVEYHYSSQSQSVTQRLMEYFVHEIHQSISVGYRHLSPDLNNIIHTIDNSYLHQLWELIARSSPDIINLLETFGRYEAIEQMADKAIMAAKHSRNKVKLTELYYCLAIIDSYGYMNYVRASERAFLGLAIARNIKNWALVCEFYFILARTTWVEGKVDQEKYYWDKIEKLAISFKLDDILFRLEEARAWRAVWHGDYAFAEATLTKVIHHAQHLKKLKLLWQSYDKLAYVFHRKGDFKLADDTYQQAIDSAFKADGVRPVTVLLGRAQNAIAWGKLSLAQIYANEALHSTQSVARPADILDAYIFCSDVALARNHYASAHDLLEKALQISRSNHIKSKECATLARLGKLYLQEGDLPQAEIFLKHALQMAKQFRHEGFMGYLYEQLAYLAFAKGQRRKIMTYGEKCLEAYDRMKMREAVEFRKWLNSIGNSNT